MNPSIIQLVEAQLINSGYHGLVNPELECGCRLGELCSCDYPDLTECVAGYEHPNDDLMYLKKG